MEPLLAGAVGLNITPPLGISMAGYAARDHGAEGVRDELAAKVLYLSQGDLAAVVVTADLISIPLPLVAAIRAELAAAHGLAAEQVLLNASHTHYGPRLVGGELEERYGRHLADKLVAAVPWAKARAVPVRASHGRAPVQIGANRREQRPDGSWTIGVNWAGSVLPYVDVLRLSDDSGRTVATLFSHACHPTTMLHHCYDISADWPGVAQRLVEAEQGGVAMFLQGCAGDINPHPRPSADSVERLGRRVGHAVLKLVTELPEPTETPRVRVGRRLFELPLEPGPADLAAARAAVPAAEERLAQVVSGEDQSLHRYWAERQVAWAKDLLAALEAGGSITGLPFEAAALAVDDCALVGLPAEVLSPIGRAIDEGSPFAHTFALGYTNGVHGYLPHAAVWEERSYEYDARVRRFGLPVTPAAGQTVVDEALALLRELV